MQKLLTLTDIMERYGINQRSARKLMGEVGVTTILHKPYVNEDALERYEADRTESSFYNRPVYRAERKRRA